jgi:hypothetical protein
MKTFFEKVDFALRVLTFVTVVGGGFWALRQYELSGSTDWANNIALETRVLPYHDDLRLLVVHITSKNPRNYAFALNSKLGDAFELRVRKVAMTLKESAVLDEDAGDIIATADLMQRTGGEYEFLPSSEMSDMRSIVLPANSTVSLTAEMKIHNGTIDKHGKPDADFISASTVVHIPNDN